MMSDGKFKDYFSDDSAGYAAYRPSYPIELIHELANISPGTERALDCACGTGQLSVLLTNRFAEVVATDASATQIANAQRHDQVLYRKALAEKSGLPAASADLITVAQAAHWLDLEKFYNEARRVAKPNAALALITYGIMHIEDDLNHHIQHFYHHIAGPYWPPERRHVEDGYRNIIFPFDEIPFPQLAIEVDWPLADLLGYIHTWSAVKAAEKALGAKPIEQFSDILHQNWGDPNSTRRIVWPLSVRAGRL